MKLPDFKYFYRTSLRRDILVMLGFGALSLFFGLIKFYIPGVEGAFSDLREIPMILGAYHLSNPLFTIGLSLLGSLNTPPEASYLSTFLFHTGALLVTSYFFKVIKRKSLRAVPLALLGYVYTYIYYVVLILPLFILTSYMVGLNLHVSFMGLYQDTLYSLRFEMISTSLIVALYLLQDRFRQSLRQYSNNLETLVDERTKHLDQAIKELKLRQQQLVQSEKMASVGTLTSGVAHEINNPLNFISGGLFMLEKIAHELNENSPPRSKQQYETALNMIKKGLSRATHIVKALSSFSKKGMSKLQAIDIHNLIDNTLLFIHRDLAGAINIAKNYQLDRPVPVYMEQIHQVLVNVLNNAFFELETVKYEKRKIKIDTYRSNGMAIIKVFNTGSHIPVDNLNRIFDPFFTTKDPNEGPGLGLSIAYMIINDHNGSITADNVEGGVEFTIQLPLK